MGVCASQPEVADSTFKQVNSYVYEFTGQSAASCTASSALNAAAGSGAHQPSQASSAAAAAAAGAIDGQKADFVLVHGLQLGSYRRAYAKTWQKREHGNAVCSLPDCIVRDYPNARVLSISYNSTAFGDVMTSSWPDAAVQVSKHLAGEHCGLNPPLGAAPLFLVGHSLGGLMIKQLCLELEQDYPEVFARIEGVMFYATPHMGSWFGNKLECLLACLPFVRKSGVLRYLRVLSEDTADLNSAFDDVRHTLDEGLRKARFATQALTETVSGTCIDCLGRVDKAYAIEGADHRDICKPGSMTDPRYTMLRMFIEKQRSVHQQRRQRMSGRLSHSSGSSSSISSAADQQPAANAAGDGGVAVAAAAAAAVQPQHIVTGVEGLTVDTSAVNAAQLRCSLTPEYKNFSRELSGDIPQCVCFDLSSLHFRGFTSSLILQFVEEAHPAVEVLKVEQRVLSDIVRDACAGVDYVKAASIKVQARAHQFELVDGCYGFLSWRWRVTKPTCSYGAKVTVEDVLIKLGSSSCHWPAGDQAQG